MTIFQAIVLALIQGVTEFLPISSSAHLALVPMLTGWPDQGLAFDVALHLGTLLAVLVYFFRDWVQVIAAGFGVRIGNDHQLAENPRLLWYMALGTIPVGVAGLAFKDKVETVLRSPYVIGTMLVAIGLLMWAADRYSTRKRQIGEIGLADALMIGTAQALAIVPGTSRSGITIVAALFRHIDRAAAARFSFLLSTPAIGGAALKSVLDFHEAGGVPEGMLGPLLVGIGVSAITGLAVIAFLLDFLRRNSLQLFVIYRVVFGIIVLALAASSAL
jgi:undecaprenyl-diphosphatase